MIAAIFCMGIILGFVGFNIVDILIAYHLSGRMTNIMIRVLFYNLLLGFMILLLLIYNYSNIQ